MKHIEMKRLEGFGIHVPEYSVILPEEFENNPSMALDAQPSLVTAPNVGIPAYLANLLDPRTIRVLVQPMKAAEFYGEEKKGDWTTLTTQFPVVEATGYTASYNDYSNSGTVGTNANWVPRQSYHFQVVQQYGDREVDMWGLAQINRVAELNYSAALIQMKKLNATYIYGVNVSGSSAGLANFGGITDPNLFAPITPTTKVLGGTTWAVATANEIYNDFLKLYAQAQAQMPGLIDRDTKMSMGLPPGVEPYLGQVTSFFTKTVREQIKDNFPNLRIVTIPEFATGAGNLLQLVVDELEGERSAYCAFTEKQRAGRVVPDTSWYRQKKTSGTWGCIIRRPVAFIQMLGI